MTQNKNLNGKKLTLSKESIKTLTHTELTDVAGGQKTQGCTHQPTALCTAFACR